MFLFCGRGGGTVVQKGHFWLRTPQSVSHEKERSLNGRGHWEMFVGWFALVGLHAGDGGGLDDHVSS